MHNFYDCRSGPFVPSVNFRNFRFQSGPDALNYFIHTWYMAIAASLPITEKDLVPTFCGPDAANYFVLQVVADGNWDETVFYQSNPANYH